MTPRFHRPWESYTPPDQKEQQTPIKSKHNIFQDQKTKEKGREISCNTLISLKGIRRLFSSLESNPSKREARRKLRLVAARAFMSASQNLQKKKYPETEMNKRLRKNNSLETQHRELQRVRLDQLIDEQMRR